MDSYELILPGTPPSFNAAGTRDRRRWSREKRLWDGYCVYALIAAKVPKGLTHVRAEATLFFTTNRKRDTVNFRTLLEKSLGDALQLGWLPDDDPRCFSFGEIAFDKVARGKPPATVVRLEVQK